MSTPKFKDKVIWITGASTEIGESLAHEFSRHDAKLILSARKKERLEGVNRSLPKNPGSAEVLEFDLQDLENLNHQVQKAFSFHGRIDYFISNAGLAIRDYAHSTNNEVDQLLMKINYFAPMYISKMILPSMIEKRSGHLVIVSSLSGKYGVPRVCCLCSLKTCVAWVL